MKIPYFLFIVLMFGMLPVQGGDPIVDTSVNSNGTPLTMTGNFSDGTFIIGTNNWRTANVTDDGPYVDFTVYINSEVLYQYTNYNIDYTISFLFYSNDPGTYNVTLEVVDLDGYSVSDSFNATFIPDTFAPLVRGYVNQSGEVGEWIELLFEFQEDTSYSYEIWVDDVLDDSGSGNGQANYVWMRIQHKFLIEGLYNVTFKISDTFGQETIAVAWFTVTADTTSPTISSSFVNTTIPAGDVFPAVGVYDGSDGTSELYIDGELKSLCTHIEDWPRACTYNFNSYYFNYGVYNLTIHAIDVFGNEIVQTAWLTIADLDPPTYTKYDGAYNPSFYYDHYHHLPDLDEDYLLYRILDENAYTYTLQVNDTVVVSGEKLVDDPNNQREIYFNYATLGPWLENRTQYWSFRMNITDAGGNHVTDQWIYTSIWYDWPDFPSYEISINATYDYTEDIKFDFEFLNDSWIGYRYQVLQDDNVVLFDGLDHFVYDPSTISHSFTNLNPGTYELLLTVWDTYREYNVTYEFEVIDSLPPMITSTVLDPVYTSIDLVTSIEFEISDVSQTQYMVYLDDVQIQQGDTTTGTNVEVRAELIASLTVGLHNLSITATDSYGNSVSLEIMIDIRFEQPTDVPTVSEPPSSSTPISTPNEETSSEPSFINTPSSDTPSDNSPAPGFVIVQVFGLVSMLTLVRSMKRKLSSTPK